MMQRNRPIERMTAKMQDLTTAQKGAQRKAIRVGVEVPKFRRGTGESAVSAERSNVRLGKVLALRALIAAGQYAVPAEAVAEAMLRRSRRQDEPRASVYCA